MSRQGLLYMFLASSGYAFFPVLAKQIQASGMASLDIATWRFALALMFFGVFISLRRAGPPATPLPRIPLMIMGGMMATAAMSALLGLERLPGGLFVLLFFTYPAMVALINLVLGERLPVQGWLALALTLIGVVLTVPDQGVGLTDEAVIGVMLALFNALVIALYFIVNNRTLKGHNAPARASAWMIGTALVIVSLTIPFRQVTMPADVTTLLFIFLLALVSTVLPVFMMNMGIQKLGASRAAIVSSLEPALALMTTGLFLGERLTPIQLLGGLFILSSVFLLQVRFRRSPVVQPAVSGD